MRSVARHGKTFTGRAIAGIAPLIAAAALLAGCAADGSLTSAAIDAPTETTTSAYGASSTAKPPDKPFNPFADPSTTTDVGIRTVLKDPTLAEVHKTGTLPEMVWGRETAPVTVIKYASLTCPFCRRFQREIYPKLKREYIDTGKIRYIIREFPIGRSSGNATIALRCAGRKNYMRLYGKFLEQQSKWVSQDVRLDKIYAVAAQVGLSRAKFDACLKNQEMIDGLKWVKDRGRTLGVIGTPNFFIGNQLVKKWLSYEELTTRIAAAGKGAVATASANAN